MGNVRHYAVKYLDGNGDAISSGYVETYKRDYKSGDIVELCFGQKIRIDFEVE